VLVIESAEGEQAVMVSLDLALFESAFQDELREMLRSALPELDVTKVFLNAPFQKHVLSLVPGEQQRPHDH
jgi:hypothetical protein